jgi:retinol-binding protein 3
MISLQCGISLVAASTLPIPDTPAGHALAAWLGAFNSGDRARLESFENAHAPWLTLDTEMARRARTGGYDLLSIDKSNKLWIVFRTKERANSAEIYGRLVVRSYAPDQITLLSLAPAGVTSPEFTLDEAERTEVVDGAAKLLAKFYLFPDAAKRVSEKLRKLQERGEYRGITDPEIFSIRPPFHGAPAYGHWLWKLESSQSLGLTERRDLTAALLQGVTLTK